MARIAVLTARYPYPLEKGDKLRIFNQIKELAPHHEIYLYALSDDSVSMEALSFCKKVRVYTISKRQRIWGVFMALLRGWPFQVGYFFNRSIKQRLVQDIHQDNVDHVHIHTLRMDSYLPEIQLPKSIDYMDALSMTYAKIADQSSLFLKWAHQWESSKLSSYEKTITSRYDHLFAISARDIKAMGLDNVHVLNNGIDLDYFEYSEDENVQDAPVIFLGNLGYTPNKQAIKYFIDTAKKIEEQHFKIYGARADEVKGYDYPHNCQLEGWIDDSRLAYHSGLCLYAPIYSGAGQQNKVLEAMSCGTPVVTTSFVANGLKLEHGNHVLIADDVNTASQHILRIKGDENLRVSLRKAGRNFVESSYKWSRSIQPLLHMLNQDNG